MLNGALNDDQLAFLTSHHENTIQVFKFLNFNKTAEDRAFAIRAIETIRNGGKVDFVNEIIKDSSFIGTKADCVLEVLLNQTGYFKEVMNAFTNSNSKYKLKFEVKRMTGQNSSAEAQTSSPDANNLITITIQPNAASGKTLDIARNLLHEGMHAQLHRIIASGNKTEYNISSKDYIWLVEELIPFWNKYSDPKFAATNTQHDFMASRYVNPIANAVRKFDGNTYPVENYLYFGWEGLYDEGSNRGLITMTEFNNYTHLASIPLNDKHKTLCE